MVRTPLLVCALMLYGATAHAQTTRQPTTLGSEQRSGVNTAVTVADSPIFVVPDSSREPLRTAKAGSRLNLIEHNGEWCLVEFQDPQFGRRRGYIETKFLNTQIARQPLDLSVPESTPKTPAQAPRAGSTRPAAMPVKTRSPQMVGWGWSLVAGGGFATLMSSGVIHPRCDTIYYDSLGRQTYEFGTCETRYPAGMILGGAMAGGGVALIYVGSRRVTVAPSRTGVGATATIAW